MTAEYVGAQAPVSATRKVEGAPGTSTPRSAMGRNVHLDMENDMDLQLGSEMDIEDDEGVQNLSLQVPTGYASASQMYSMDVSPRPGLASLASIHQQHDDVASQTTYASDHSFASTSRSAASTRGGREGSETSASSIAAAPQSAQSEKQAAPASRISMGLALLAAASASIGAVDPVPQNYGAFEEEQAAGGILMEESTVDFNVEDEDEDDDEEDEEDPDDLDLDDLDDAESEDEQQLPPLHYRTGSYGFSYNGPPTARGGRYGTAPAPNSFSQLYHYNGTLREHAQLPPSIAYSYPAPSIPTVNESQAYASMGRHASSSRSPALSAAAPPRKASGSSAIGITTARRGRPSISRLSSSQPSGSGNYLMSKSLSTSATGGTYGSGLSPVIGNSNNAGSRRKSISSSTTAVRSPNAFGPSSESFLSSSPAAQAYVLKRTEIPAVADDPSVKPYGCCYPACIARAEKKRLVKAAEGKASRAPTSAGKAKDESSSSGDKSLEEDESSGKDPQQEYSASPVMAFGTPQLSTQFQQLLDPALEKDEAKPAVISSPSPPNIDDTSSGSEDADSEQEGSSAATGKETSFRTIKELREHWSLHKKAGDDMDGLVTPFRCSIAGCGKTFKSLAGLRWHFQNAASNGHFYVSLEDGENAPSKKFKATVESKERREVCPMPGCRKAFKQAAGLAYHLAHATAPNHVVTEQLIDTFPATLASKVRWWHRKQAQQAASTTPKQAAPPIAAGVP